MAVRTDPGDVVAEDVDVGSSEAMALVAVAVVVPLPLPSTRRTSPASDPNKHVKDHVPLSARNRRCGQWNALSGLYRRKDQSSPIELKRKKAGFVSSLLGLGYRVSIGG